MKESEAYAKLRPFLARLFAVDRVENAILPGMPDVILSCNDKTIFVEMKAQVGKHLRGSQVAWCLRRHKLRCYHDMFALSYDNNEWHVFWMVDVANNAGLLSLSLDYVLYTNPEHVARFFYDILFNYEGAVNDIRGRA